MRKVGEFCILAILTFGLFSLAAARQDEGKIKAETEPINIDVVVKDGAGRQPPELKKEDFEIYEDGALQEIAHIKPAPHPLRLILVFDTSVSMGAIHPAIKDEAVKLVESLNQQDEIMVGGFDTDLQLSADWGGKARATSDILALKSPPSPPPILPQAPSPFPFPRPAPRGKVPPDKDTNLFGAMYTIFERFGGRRGNEVVVLISDGKDSLDRNLAKDRPVKDPKQVIQKAQQSWAQIYGACFKIERESSGIGIPIGGRGYGSDCKFLSEIAGATGGRSFEFDSQSALAQVLKKTHDELKSQYTLAYYPSSQGNKAGFHNIKVVVKKPDMIIRAREGYLISK
jgi:Ca-activated chloride channel family protein